VRLLVEQATEPDLKEIAEWRYEPPYDFYDGDQDPVQDPERYYTARDETEGVVGFYYFEPRGDLLVYGLGLRPDLAGRGLGLDFVRHGLEFGRGRFRPRRIVLSVAAFNERARIVYERAGFQVSGRHVRTFERWGDVEFVEMEER
jgi:RimJ/RimL family protein N-acetyltransferase